MLLYYPQRVTREMGPTVLLPGEYASLYQLRTRIAMCNRSEIDIVGFSKVRSTSVPIMAPVLFRPLRVAFRTERIGLTGEDHSTGRTVVMT